MLLPKYLFLLCVSTMPIITLSMNKNFGVVRYLSTNNPTQNSSNSPFFTILDFILPERTLARNGMPYVLNEQHCTITKRHNQDNLHIALYQCNKPLQQHTYHDSTKIVSKRKNVTTAITSAPSVPTHNFIIKIHQDFINYIAAKNFKEAEIIIIRHAQKISYTPFTIAYSILNGKINKCPKLENADQWKNYNTGKVNKKLFFRFLLYLSMKQFHESQTFNRSALFSQQYKHLRSLNAPLVVHK